MEEKFFHGANFLGNCRKTSKGKAPPSSQTLQRLIRMVRYLFHLILFFYLPFFLAGRETIVCPSCEINSIKKAIELSSARDSIIVESGLYKERNIIIDKSIRLIGKNYPIVDGEHQGEIFSIDADSVLICGFHIRNVGISYTQDQAGIRISKRKKCIIENNILLNTYFGIYLANSNDCIIRNNEVKGFEKRESQTGNAIHLFRCNKIFIENNNLSGHRDGIYFEFVENTKISNNISSNQIRYGMHFMFSHDNEYFHNTFSNNGAGVAVMYSKNIFMHENTFSDNWSSVSNGILLKDITDSRIFKNHFERNTIGLYAEGCLRIEIEQNEFSKNGWAVKILGNSENNRFLNNNFIANTFEVVTNSSSNSNIFENNFWSEYSGYDLDKDGTGDIPHSPVKLFTYIVENNQAAIILLRSLFIDLLNLAEKVTPVITPVTLTDASPMMKQFQW